MKRFSIDKLQINVPANDGVVVLSAGDEVRVYCAKEYNLIQAQVLVFGADGRLQEAGGNLYTNPDGKLGSPQLTLRVPAHGFAVVFGKDAGSDLFDCHAFAMEGAMLYNATMTIDREVFGSFDGKTLDVWYEENVHGNPMAIRFLFLGNSCIYFNGVPLKFRALCRAAGLAVDVTYCTVGGAFLRQYLDPEHRCHQKMKEVLKAKKYDFAILQDANAATAEETENSVRGLLPYLKENGARLFLYARSAATAEPIKNREETARLWESYYRAGKAFDAPVAPAVLAFARCMERYPELELYADDRSHHSAYGSYLVACCMVETYLRIDVRGLAYDAYFGTEVASKLQEIAHEVCYR